MFGLRLLLVTKLFGWSLFVLDLLFVVIASSLVSFILAHHIPLSIPNTAAESGPEAGSIAALQLLIRRIRQNHITVLRINATNPVATAPGPDSFFSSFILTLRSLIERIPSLTIKVVKIFCFDEVKAGIGEAFEKRDYLRMGYIAANRV